MRFFRLMLFVFGVALLCGGCRDGSPTAPSPDPGPPIDGTPPPEPPPPPPPPPAPPDFTSPDGLVKISYVKSRPEQDGEVSDGREALVWLDVDNSANGQRLSVCPSVVDSPEDNPGRPGRMISMSGFGSCSNLDPGATDKSMVFGFSAVSGAQDIPYLRLSLYYNNSQNQNINRPEWNHHVRLNWKKR